MNDIEKELKDLCASHRETMACICQDFADPGHPLTLEEAAKREVEEIQRVREVSRSIRETRIEFAKSNMLRLNRARVHEPID